MALTTISDAARTVIPDTARVCVPHAVSGLFGCGFAMERFAASTRWFGHCRRNPLVTSGKRKIQSCSQAMRWLLRSARLAASEESEGVGNTAPGPDQ